MATEAQWEVQESNFNVSPQETYPAGHTNDGQPMDRLIYNSPPFDIYGNIAETNLEGPTIPIRETRAVQITSYLLYSLKEYLVKSGWTVVSSSYRDSTNYFKQDGNGTQVGGFWSSANNTNGRIPADFASTQFVTVAGDGWKPVNGAGGLTSPEEFNEETNPAYSVIYPGYVPVKGGVAGSGTTLDQYKRKGIESGHKIIQNQTFLYGRSWCLLRAPDTFREPGALEAGNNANYHIVLDFTHNAVPKFLNDIIAVSAGPGAYDYYYPVFTSADYDEATPGFVPNQLNFGAYINVIVLPDYGDALTNIEGVGNNNTYTPNETRRPSHVNEVSYSPRETDLFLGSKFFKIVDNTSEKYFVNLINTVQGTTPAGMAILGSASGQPKFNIVLSSIADPLNQQIVHANKGANTYSGEKQILFWSNIERKGQINKSFSATTDKLPSLIGTFFDSREEWACMYYYSNYSPGKSSGKYNQEVISTCVPVIFSQLTSNKYGPQMLLTTTPLSKATADYTYMEWPLPLIKIQGYTRNFNYAGRMLDIKLGPAGAPSGILAQETGTTNYDRILFNGLWFPYNGTSALLF